MSDNKVFTTISATSDWYGEFKRDLRTFALIFLVILIVLPWLLFKLGIGLDDTDSPTHASGMHPYIDARTGCQYLSTGSGALTPRLDASGKPLCGKEFKDAP